MTETSNKLTLMPENFNYNLVRGEMTNNSREM